jgi:hypothetical protein
VIDTSYAPLPFKHTDVYAAAVPGSATGGWVGTFTYRTVNGFSVGHASTRGWPRHLWPAR